MKYEEIFDVIVEIEFIKNTTNNDTEFTKEIYKLHNKLKTQEGVEL